VFLAVVALVAVPAASAKGRLTIAISDRTPQVGKPFTVTVHTGWTVGPHDWLRLIAVAPGIGWYSVVGVVTKASGIAHANIPHDGFGIKLVRVGPKTWRATVRLPRAGRWRLVVPNGSQYGFMLPPPTDWMPWVQVHR
jgi:hypothetical protein